MKQQHTKHAVPAAGCGDAARLALRAAFLRRTIGRWAAARYAEKNGVRGLYRIALQLEAASQAGM